MIPLSEQQGIRDLFAEALASRVKIDLFTQRRTAMFLPGQQECRFCDDTQTVLEELSRLHTLLTLTVHQIGADREQEKKLGVTGIPATVLRGVLNRPVVILGFPMGTIFPALVETIVLMSRNRTELPPAVLKKLKRLHEPVGVRVFVSPDSEFCPPMVLAAFAFAIESKLVRAEVVEVAEFERMAERYRVDQVPFTVIDDRISFPGLIELETFADQLVRAKASPTLAPQPPRSGGSTPLRREPGQENVRPSGLIVPGR